MALVLSRPMVADEPAASDIVVGFYRRTLHCVDLAHRLTPDADDILQPGLYPEIGVTDQHRAPR